MKKFCLSISILIFTQTAQAALPIKETSTQLVQDWDTTLINHTPYTLSDPVHTLDEKGWLINTPVDAIPPHQEILAYQLQANYLGQISQTMSYSLTDNGTEIGHCLFHAGVGSFMANPDFTGTECHLLDGTNVPVTPGYKISAQSRYEVEYLVGSQQKFSRIISFGDSLSDNGNLWKLTAHRIPPSPPYFHGRFSDGKVWVEYLADNLHLSADQLEDFAYGGAASSGETDPAIGGSSVSGESIIPVTAQINEYKWLNFSGDPFALYTLWIGPNEIYAGYNQKEATCQRLLRNVVASIKDLAHYGAKTFLIPNLPNLGITADAHKQDAINGDHHYSEGLAAASLYYNELLSNALPELEQELGIRLIFVNINHEFEDIIKNPDHYGLTNVVDACNPNNHSGGDLPICQDSYHYLFWDDIHPTTVIHQHLADRIYQNFHFIDSASQRR